uniref:Uncharacterized protein n=1 Tax=Megaselia scalaris TaxID=36166 RepID=T1GE15_MEGSC
MPILFDSFPHARKLVDILILLLLNSNKSFDFLQLTERKKIITPVHPGLPFYIISLVTVSTITKIAHIGGLTMSSSIIANHSLSSCIDYLHPNSSINIPDPAFHSFICRVPHAHQLNKFILNGLAHFALKSAQLDRACLTWEHMQFEHSYFMKLVRIASSDRDRWDLTRIELSILEVTAFV